jgi:hypothetical protein
MQASDTTLSSYERECTLGYPVWLVVLCVVLLPLRLFFTWADYGRSHESLGATQLTANVDTVADGRPVLYVFLRDDGQSSWQLWNALTDNRAIAGLVRDRFKLVAVVDNENGPGAKNILFKKYSVAQCPTVVSALTDGMKIRDVSGFISSQLLYEFLRTSLADRDYTEAKRLLREGKIADAYRSFSHYVEETDVASGHYAWAQYFRVICLLLLHDQAQAQTLAEHSMTHTRVWDSLSDVFSYLAGKTSSQRMLEASDYGFNADAGRLAVAVKLLADGKRGDAQQNLQWIKEHANQTSFHRKVALDLLAREFGQPISEDHPRLQITGHQVPDADDE